MDNSKPPFLITAKHENLKTRLSAYRSVLMLILTFSHVKNLLLHCLVIKDPLRVFCSRRRMASLLSLTPKVSLEITSKALGPTPLLFAMERGHDQPGLCNVRKAITGLDRVSENLLREKRMILL